MAGLLEIDSEMKVVPRNETAKILIDRIFTDDELSKKSCRHWVFQDEFGNVLEARDRPIDLTMQTGRQISRKIFGIARAERPPVWLRLSTKLAHGSVNNMRCVIVVVSEADALR
jgi:hypothetical protein